MFLPEPDWKTFEKFVTEALRAHAEEAGKALMKSWSENMQEHGYGQQFIETIMDFATKQTPSGVVNKGRDGNGGAEK